MSQAQEVTMKDRNITVLGANMVFLIGIIALGMLDIFLSVKKVKLDMIGLPTAAIEVIFFLLPSCIYIILKRQDIKQVLRLNKISIGNALTVVGMMIFALPLIGFTNYIIISIINMIGTPIPNPMPEIDSLKDLFVGVAVVALSPAICEEVMSRGVFLRGYEGFSKKAALIISALLFSVMHRNIQSLIPIFFIGLLLGYVVYRTNSIFAGMIVHFVNNAFAVAATYLTRMLQRMMGMSIDELQVAEMPQFNLSTAIGFMVIVIFAATMFIGLLTLLRHNTERIVQQEADEIQEGNRRVPFSHYVPLILGLGFIGFEYMMQIFYILSLPVPFISK